MSLVLLLFFVRLVFPKELRSSLWLFVVHFLLTPSWFSVIGTSDYC